MQRIIKNIDPALWEAVSNSPFNVIDYENLLKNNPAKIREEERRVSLNEVPAGIPKQLDVKNIEISSSEKSRKIRLRIYRPKGGKKPTHIVIFSWRGLYIWHTRTIRFYILQIGSGYWYADCFGGLPTSS